MVETFLAVLAAVGTAVGLIFGAVVTLRSGRSTAEKTAGETYSKLLADLQTQQDRDRTESDRRHDKSAASILTLEKNLEDERAHSREQDRALRSAEVRVESIQRALRLYVTPLVLWLDRGAIPPPPMVDQELRELLQVDTPSPRQ